MAEQTKIRGIVIEDDDLTFYFEGSEDPWGIGEFVQHSLTRVALEKVEAAVLDFNNYVVKEGATRAEDPHNL